jgi:hypothetical protein
MAANISQMNQFDPAILFDKGLACRKMWEGQEA